LTACRSAPSVHCVEASSGELIGAAPVAGERSRSSRQLRRALRSGVVTVGAVCAALIVLLAIFAGKISPYAPDEQNFDLIEARPSAHALFGTDRFGRDVLSRVIHGSRISLYVAVTSIAISMTVGGALGLVAGYLGGAWDNAINRVMDVFFSIPGLLLAVGVAAMRGPGVNSAVIAIAIVYTPLFARVMRGPVLAEREKEYVEAVRALGAPRWKVALKHILPNVLSPFVVQGTVAFSQAILIEASLSYLGLSAQPPTPSWGNMLNEGRTYLETAPWISVFPGIAIMLTVLAFNLLGDGLRDVLDPNEQ
jgi:peptide/nickel transport system permease protein